MHVCEYNGRIQYYANKDGKRSYIREGDRQLVRDLCQKDYDQKVLRSAQKELKQLEKLSAFYSEASREPICEDIYEQMSDRRRVFVEPIQLSDEEYQAMGSCGI